MHLDLVDAVLVPAANVESSAAWTLGAVQHALDLLERLGREVRELEIHRAVRRVELAVELEHHLPAPVVALDEAIAARIDGVTPERPRHVSAGRPIVVFDERV